MHRLKTRKKAKAAEEDVPAVPSLPFLSKKKHAPPPEKPEVDIDAALPSTDDFRTSLLMPNLAQRFSILQMEQAAAAAAAIEAEKNGGKQGSTPQNQALFQFPSQQFGNLGDIAETASLNGSIASSNRYTTRSDEGRPSEDGSVMNRPRGGEGNILFGGRQKVYRVPAKTLRGASSMDDLQADRPLRGAKSYYEQDVPESIARPKAVDDEHLSLSTERNMENHNDTDHGEYNNNRFTNSSTNSMPNTNNTRFSTAATSINSQQGQSAINTAPTSVPQSPTTSKPRRPLYEQALDQQLQEQKNTAMGRLERLASMRRAGAASPTPRGESPVPGSLNSAMTPSSPTSRQPLGRTWSSKRGAADVPISPTVEEAPEELPEPGNPASSKKLSPGPIAGFDFGIPPPETRVRSPSLESIPSPPAKTEHREPPSRRASEDSVRPHQQQQEVRSQSPSLSDHPGFRSFSPARQPECSDNLSDYLSSRGVSRQQSMDQVTAIEELERELNSPILPSARFGPRIEIPEIDQNGVSEPSSPVSVASSVSALSVMRSDAGPQPIKTPTKSSAAMLSDDGNSSESDSPTLPARGGLSAMVRQHLRSNSDASSIYADSVFTRQSRFEPLDTVPALPARESRRYEPRGSESSIGNPWQYEEFETPDPDEMKVPDLPESPSSVYRTSMAPGDSPTRRFPPPTQDSPPPVPHKSPERPSSRMGASRPGSAMGGRSESRIGGRPESRSGYRSESRPPPSRPGSRMGRPESRGGNYPDSRMGSRANSRMGRSSDEDMDAGRNRSMSRGAEERSFSHAGEAEEEAWAQQLASRRQILQERIQEKVLSMHETEGAPGPSIVPGKPTGGLRNKASNGFMNGKLSRPPTAEGSRSRPPSRPSSRNRQHAFDPLEDEYSLRQVIRGPHHVPAMDQIHPAQRPPMGHPLQRPPIDQMHPAQRPPNMHPTQRMNPGAPGHRGPPPPRMHPSQRGPPDNMHPAQRPHPDQIHPSQRGHPDQMHPSQRPGQQRPRRPSLNTHQSAPHMRPNPSPGLPHPKHAPMYTPPLRQKMSQEHMNGATNGEHAARGGLAPGWNEMPLDSPRSGYSGRSHPGTPHTPGTPAGTPDPSRHPRHRAPRPNGDGYFPDGDPRRMRSPPRAIEEPPAMRSNGYKMEDSSEKELDGHSHSSGDSLERKRSNSNESIPEPRGGTRTGRNSPMPFSSPPPKMEPASPPRKQHSPAKVIDQHAVVKTIQETNAQFLPVHPPRKRVITKDQISKPKLITKTSSIPTVDLPGASVAATTPIDTPTSATTPGGRRKTRADLFASLGKKGEETPSSTKSDEEDDKSRRGLTSRLRKSISDGGGLSQRGRVVDMAARHDAMPKINKAAIGSPVSGAPPGMI